jgi:hypothetical protein
MPDEVKAHLRTRARNKVHVRSLTETHWQVACDWADESAQRISRAAEVACLGRGSAVRAPSYLPRLAIEVLRARLPHTVVTLSAGPGRTRTVPAFYWPTLRLVYAFLGVYREKKGREPALATREIAFRPGSIPLRVVDPSDVVR